MFGKSDLQLTGVNGVIKHSDWTDWWEKGFHACSCRVQYVLFRGQARQKNYLTGWASLSLAPGSSVTWHHMGSIAFCKIVFA